MKHFLSKVKKGYKRFMTGKSAFSLVELIVVIAIMAVMAAVLAPALLGYVEKSRMQKDSSAMDEVVNAVQLSLADQSIYDEVLEHSVWDNVSCYIDKKDESQFADCKVQLKAEHGDKKEQYMFGDKARLLDETVYYAAGNMRGLTITFSPSESGDTYDFANGILNKFVGRKTGLLSENPELYNRLRSVIGDKLDTTSQTYRNSDYTIFIRVGSTGGSEAVMQDAVQVWGQFNGTNLAEKDHKYELSSGRVVGADGQNDATNNEKQNENNNDDVFSESYVPPKSLTTLTRVDWGTNTIRSGNAVWFDGTNVYYKDIRSSYVLKDGVWTTKTWQTNPYASWDCSCIWSDGNNFYFSSGTTQLVLDNDVWKPKTWEGLTEFSASNIWTDGINIYYSKSSNHYVLHDDTWEPITWNGFTVSDGRYVWRKGQKVYFSSGTTHYVLEDTTWKQTTFTTPDGGSKNVYGDRIWTDGVDYYFNNGDNASYVLDGNNWIQKDWVWTDVTSPNLFYGNSVWTDGQNYYFTFNGETFRLS